MNLIFRNNVLEQNGESKMKKVIFIMAAILTFSFMETNGFIGKSNTSADDSISNQNSDKKMNNISSIKVRDINGKEINLSAFKGKVILIVNVASQCGYTPQYKSLQQLYEKYKNQGFEILAFPCNDFGGQEPGSNQEIKEFCSSNYGVTFKLFDKIKILGKDKSRLYAVLTDNDVTGTRDVKWNFEKFIISKNGVIVARFPSRVDPMDKQVTQVVESQLKAD